MYVNRRHSLSGSAFGRFHQGVPDEQRTDGQRAIRQSTVDVDLVLPLQRDKNPLAGRVKIQMADLITETSRGRNRKPFCQHSILVAENLQRISGSVLLKRANGCTAAEITVDDFDFLPAQTSYSLGHVVLKPLALDVLAASRWIA